MIIRFKDCNDNVILESKGSSNIKEFEEGLQDALMQALMKIPVSNPVALLPAADNVQNSSPESFASAAAPEANNYSNGKLDLQKIKIDSNQFILAKSGNAVPFAVFKTTSKNSVFMVKLADGSTTIGYFENGNIVIDIPQPNGRYSKEIFAGK